MPNHFRKMSEDYEEIRIFPNGNKILIIKSNDKRIRKNLTIRNLNQEEINEDVVHYFNDHPEEIPECSAYLSQHPEIADKLPHWEGKIHYSDSEEDSDSITTTDTLTDSDLDSDSDSDYDPNKYPPVQMITKPEFQPKPEPEKPKTQPKLEPKPQKEVQKEPEPKSESKTEAQKPKFKQSIKNNNYVEITLNFTFN